MFIDAVDDLWDLLPDGPDKTTALRQLHIASMLCVSAVAQTTPADWVNPQVARVLPDPPTGEGATPSTTLSSGGPTASSPGSGGSADSAPSAAVTTSYTPDPAPSEPQPVQPDGTAIPTPDPTAGDGPAGPS